MALLFYYVETFSGASLSDCTKGLTGSLQSNLTFDELKKDGRDLRLINYTEVDKE